MSYLATSFSGGGGSSPMSVLPNPNFEGIEIAGRTVEKMLHGDGQFPALQDKLRVGKEFKNFKVDLKKFNFCYFLYLTMNRHNFC
jgi:hypothetical protein